MGILLVQEPFASPDGVCGLRARERALCLPLAPGASSLGIPAPLKARGAWARGAGLRGLPANLPELGLPRPTAGRTVPSMWWALVQAPLIGRLPQ